MSLPEGSPDRQTDPKASVYKQGEHGHKCRHPQRSEYQFSIRDSSNVRKTKWLYELVCCVVCAWCEVTKCNDRCGERFSAGHTEQEGHVHAVHLPLPWWLENLVLASGLKRVSPAGKSRVGNECFDCIDSSTTSCTPSCGLDYVQ